MPTRDELLEQIRRQAAEQARAIAEARAEAAARGKQELDHEVLARLRKLKPRRPEPIAELEYLYYVRRPEIMTIAELARVLDEVTNWAD